MADRDIVRLIVLGVAVAVGIYFASTDDLDGVRNAWIYRLALFTAVARETIFFVWNLVLGYS